MSRKTNCVDDIPTSNSDSKHPHRLLVNSHAASKALEMKNALRSHNSQFEKKTGTVLMKFVP